MSRSFALTPPATAAATSADTLGDQESERRQFVVDDADRNATAEPERTSVWLADEPDCVAVEVLAATKPAVEARSAIVAEGSELSR